ncbi:MAG TPA: metallophosphoesterase, partial [Gemmatimonadaceae bacterium]
ADDKTIVFVSVPTDWRTVGASWRAVAASDSVNFPLRAERQPRSFRFIHASDTHIDTGDVARVRRFRTLDDSINPALTLLAGDLIRDAMSQQEPRARGYFELFLAEMKLRTPYWTVPGNHDHFGIIQSRSHVPETHPLYNRGMYRLYMGPEYYSFNYGGVHFIGLETVQPDDSAYYGGVDSLQLAWLTRDVATVPASTPIVTFSHIPLASGIEPLTGYLDMALVSSVAHPKAGITSFRHTGANTLAVLDVFKGRPLPLILGGHTHVAEKLVFQTDRGPLRFEQSAAIVGPNDYGPVVMPSGFSLYTVTNGVIDAGTFVPLTMPKP